MKKEDVELIIVTGKSGAGKQPRIDVLTGEFGLDQLSTGNIFREYLGILKKTRLEIALSSFWDESKNDFIPDEEIKKILENEGNSDVQDLILGIKAKYFIEAGKFVPDKITNSLFANYFKKYNYTGVVLDGYPRTNTQSQFLLNLLEKNNKTISFVLIVENDDETIIQRITGRRICPNDGKVFHIKYKPPKDGKYCTECDTEVVLRSDDNEENIKTRLLEFKNKTIPALKVLEDAGIPIIKVPGNLPVFTDEKVRESVMNALSLILP